MKRVEITNWLYFARCIALIPSLPFLTGFAVQTLVAVSVCRLANTREVLPLWLAPAQDPLQIFGSARLSKS